jgi:hypothetical protein
MLWRSEYSYTNEEIIQKSRTKYHHSRLETDSEHGHKQQSVNRRAGERDDKNEKNCHTFYDFVGPIEY